MPGWTEGFGPQFSPGLKSAILFNALGDPTGRLKPVSKTTYMHI